MVVYVAMFGFRFDCYCLMFGCLVLIVLVCLVCCLDLLLVILWFTVVAWCFIVICG